jgi:hypothetical protein
MAKETRKEQKGFQENITKKCPEQCLGKLSIALTKRSENPI